MDGLKAKELLYKYKSGICTKEEKAIIESWYLQYEAELSGDLSEDELMADLRDIKKWLPVKRNPVLNRPLVFAAAAALLVFCTFGLYFFRQPAHPVQKDVVVRKADIGPGTDKAILILGNGRRISLDNARHDLLAKQGDTKINSSGGTLVYDASGSAGDAGSEVSYNTIVTPRAGQFQVILPDRSHVWLNAASSIRFPAVFKKGTREVEISGEAYFEVSKDKSRPFIVRSGRQTLEVLGTHFNVMAYRDEKSIKTTLLEGSVRISKGKESRLLAPGQQSSLNENIRVAETDPLEAVAWKNGLTLFANEDIKTVMRRISRWYDVDVEYKGEIPERIFTGGISRSSRLSELLKILELNDIHFLVSDKKITVMP